MLANAETSHGMKTKSALQIPADKAHERSLEAKKCENLILLSLMLFGYFITPNDIFISEVVYLARRNRKAEVQKKTEPKTELSGMVLSNMPHIEMEGNREIIVDGCKGILVYETDKIKINASGVVMGVSGDELNIRAYADEQIIINGNILSMDFS